MISEEIATKLVESQRYWDSFADSYATINSKITIQATKIMHDNMDLVVPTTTIESTTSTSVQQQPLQILEVASASGMGTEDLLTRGKSLAIHATDFSSVMVEQMQKRFENHPHKDQLVQIEQGNALDLNKISSGSMDRYIAGLCLQLVPCHRTMIHEARRVLKSGGLAGFTIWGRPENSGVFTLIKDTAVAMGEEGMIHPNFALGHNMNELLDTFRASGFSPVVYWPVWTLCELWDAEAYIDFVMSTFTSFIKPGEDGIRQRQAMLKLATEWLESGKPIGLENYIIIARAD